MCNAVTSQQYVCITPRTWDTHAARTLTTLTNGIYPWGNTILLSISLVNNMVV